MKLILPEKLQLENNPTAHDYLECLMQMAEHGEPEDALLFSICPDENSPERKEYEMGKRLFTMLIRYKKRFSDVTLDEIAKQTISIASSGYSIPGPLLEMLGKAFLEKRAEGRGREERRHKNQREATIVKVYYLLLAGGKNYFDTSVTKNKTSIIGHCCSIVGRSENNVKAVLKKYGSNEHSQQNTIVDGTFHDAMHFYSHYIGEWFTSASRLDSHKISKKLPLPTKSFSSFEFGKADSDSLNRLRDFLEHQKTI